MALAPNCAPLTRWARSLSALAPVLSVQTLSGQIDRLCSQADNRQLVCCCCCWPNWCTAGALFSLQWPCVSALIWHTLIIRANWQFVADWSDTATVSPSPSSSMSLFLVCSFVLHWHTWLVSIWLCLLLPIFSLWWSKCVCLCVCVSLRCSGCVWPDHMRTGNRVQMGGKCNQICGLFVFGG